MDVPETRYATNDAGQRIAYQVVGDGPTDVLFAPVFACVDLMWDDPACASFLRRLSTIGRLIAFDFRGIGASDPVSLTALPTLEEWVDDMRAVLAASGSESATVVTSSLYGILGLVFAAAHPELTDALVVVDGFARSAYGDDYRFAVQPEVLDLFAQTAEAMWGSAAMAPLNAPSRRDDAGFRRWYGRAQRLSASPAEIGAYYRMAVALDVRPVLPVIRAPTLVLHSTTSQTIPLDHGRYLAEHIPNAKLVTLSGDGEFFLEADKGNEVADHIEEFATGVRPLPEPDRALATVLFTDIVSSTETAARLGDKRWTAVLDGHDEIAARELERHRGRKVNPTGDGMLATFDGPARAIRCAQAICRAVRPLGIEVRAGLHTGEVERRGYDIGGIAVHIGQRVSALAGPGEVLVSRTVTDLVAGSGLEFEDRGEHELKGVPGRWAIYAVAP